MYAEEFQEQLGELKRKLFEMAWGPEVPEVGLLHYTGAEGLRGIVESHVIRAGHLGFMNDRTELSYASTLIEPLYEERIRGYGGLVEQLLKHFLPARYRLADGFDVYALCLSEAKDDLAAWMTYGRAGGGYAIELDLSRTGKDRILKVIYDRPEQVRLLEAILDMARNFLTHVFAAPIQVDSEEQGLDYMRRFVVLLHEALAMCAPRFKHPAFSGEREWRFIAVREKGTPKERPNGFRAAGNIVAPYVEFPFKDLMVPADTPIKAIWLGPNVDEFGIRSVKLLLSKSGYRGVKIESSSIPLRTAK
ncbi:MAG: DUF2971 domain-containing protein [Acidobacteria bacterium]|nr:DUF2971 domain-containing protein [Acidobacteriota bacterium]